MKLWRAAAKRLHAMRWALWIYALRNRLRGLDLKDVSADDLRLPPTSNPYGDSGGPDLEFILRALPIAPSDAIIDVGCGKGGAVITLARHFTRADGVDVSEPLVHSARENLRRLGVQNADIFLSDAVTFDAFDRYSHLYLFNPFTGSTFRDFMEAIDASVQRRPRALTLIYAYPAEDEVVRNFGFVVGAAFRHGSYPVGVYTRRGNNEP